MESATSNNGPKPLEHHFHANQIRDKKRGEFSIESLLLSKGNQSLKGKCVEFNMCSSKAKNIGLCSVSLCDRTTVKWNLLEELCRRMKNCTGSFSVFFIFPDGPYLNYLNDLITSIIYHIFCSLDECSSGEETGPNIFVPPTTQCLKARAPKHSLLCSSPIPGSGNHHHGIVTYLFSSNLSKRQNDTDKQNVLIW